MIETARLKLRHWREEDADDLFRYASDPKVSELALWPCHTSPEMSREVIRQYFMPDKDVYAMELKESGEVIGCIGLVAAGEEHYAPIEKEREVGYWIGRPHWGKGLTPEALNAMLDHWRDSLGLKSLLLTTDARNAASRRVAEKCGFTPIARYTLNSTSSLAFRLPLHQ